MEIPILELLDPIEALLSLRKGKLQLLQTNQTSPTKNLMASDPILEKCSKAARNHISQGVIADLTDEIQTLERMIASFNVRRLPMKIKISDLRTLADKLLSNIEEMEGEIVEIQHDYYWAISRSALYDLEKDPCKNSEPLPVRQLTRHWADLQPILHGARAQPVALVWFSGLLTAIGYMYAD